MSFFSLPLIFLPRVFILIETGLKGKDEKKRAGKKRQRERERSWRRTASSQLQQRGLADLDPG